MGLFPSKNKFEVDGKTVILTGGSQGAGKAIAKLLAAKGANVIIVARDQAKLKAALEEISAAAKNSKQRFHAISADVTIYEENERLLQEAMTWNSGQLPDVVWANAGSAHPSFFAETSIATLRAQMDINYWAAAYLAYASLQHFLSSTNSAHHTVNSPPPSSPRHIIMTNSVISLSPLAGYSPYAPAKAAMRSLADCLRQEVLLYNAARRTSAPGPAPPDRDVKIHIFVPATILSPGLEAENRTKHPVTKRMEESDTKQTEEEVAIAAIAGLERGQFMIVTHWLGRLMRGGAMGSSPRENIVVDTIMSWVAAIAWLFVGPELDGKVWHYGKVNGMKRDGAREAMASVAAQD